MSNDTGSPTTDDHVDAEIRQYLNPKKPRSFFLYAGAGSGKTRSLKEALTGFREQHGEVFRRTGRKIAIITYTNAAANEIAERVGHDQLFPISTIHSFCWSLINPYHGDIQNWLLEELPQDIAELEEKQRRGRANSQASIDRQNAITAAKQKLLWLSEPRQFTYNPNGDNYGRSSLSHAEVIAIAANFIEKKNSLQALITNLYPFILIDESQDTNKELMASLFALEEKYSGSFALGLFGDMMQRIYFDGQADLESRIPTTWARPVKKMNHRSSQRVVALANALRAKVDNQHQLARDSSEEGLVRLFITSAEHLDKVTLESQCKAKMALLGADEMWIDETSVKTLTLEHRMAALRGGFVDLFDALDEDSRLSTGLRRGDLAGIRLFTERVVPLITAIKSGDGFSCMSLIRKHSPLFKRKIVQYSVQQGDPLQPIREAVQILDQSVTDQTTVKLMDILKCVYKTGLFDIPAALYPFVHEIDNPVSQLNTAIIDSTDEAESYDAETSPSSLKAWRSFLDSSYDQISRYSAYINDLSPYGTHQGVKGLEYERVLVILDDSAAKGFMFSFDKAMGAKPPSENDRKNALEGKERTEDRTKRLLYVCATRAKKSLAIVAYSSDPLLLKKSVTDWKWFAPGEIEIIGD